MMIPHINTKDSSKISSDDSRTKKDMKNHFSRFIRKINLIYLPLTEKPIFTKLSADNSILSFAKEQLSQRQ